MQILKIVTDLLKINQNANFNSENQIYKTLGYRLAWERFLMTKREHLAS